MKQKRLLLVNSFSSARYVSQKLKDHHVYTVALYTLDLNHISEYIKPANDLFDEQLFVNSSNISEIIKVLGDQKFDYVINGSEISGEITDQLVNYYTPEYANNFETSRLRFDKYKMHEALAQNNLAHIKQYLYSRDDKLPDISIIGLDFPCFVKPLEGLATVGANKINTQIELEKYFISADSINNPLQINIKSKLFLISEYIHGEEFLIDTFSANGNHYLSSIQKYSKFYYNDKPVHGFTDVITNKKLLADISNYIFNVLDVLEYKNGFAHTEVFITPNGEIKLIEVNPRVSGASGYVNKLAKLNNLPDQIDLLMEHIFHIKYTQNIPSNKVYRRVTLFNLSGNALYNLQQNLSKYETFFEVFQIAPDGHTQNNQEIALVDAIAFVILASDQLDKLNFDTKKILAQDKIGWN